MYIAHIFTNGYFQFYYFHPLFLFPLSFIYAFDLHSKSTKSTNSKNTHFHPSYMYTGLTLVTGWGWSGVTPFDI